jgi:hypothetical protein
VPVVASTGFCASSPAGSGIDERDVVAPRLRDHGETHAHAAARGDVPRPVGFLRTSFGSSIDSYARWT